MSELLVDHLWQSALVAALAGLLALLLRRNHARTRYWLWLAASVKFLVPFTALVALGSQFTWLAPVTVSRTEVLMLDTAGVPSYRAAIRIELPRPRVPESPTLSSTTRSRMAIGLWIAGAALILLKWAIGWRRVATVVRGALPVEDGRVLETLRRLERFGGRRTSIAIVSSDTLLEPGVFGLLRPVLWWPRRLEEHLSDQQVEAILTHELVHVRRRDNLTAAVHMVVQAVFWFNPLVWWIGRRLIDERERACDEAVIRWGSNRQVYAESILKTCRFSIQSPLACAAGVTGADLKKRIESIMRSPAGEPLSAAKSILLILAGVATVATPVVVGALSPRPRVRAQALADAPAFDVASVKPNKSDNFRIVMEYLPGGRFAAVNVPLRLLIRNAYQLEAFDLVGGPGWVNTARFDITAKAEGDASPQAMRLMLRSLLTERFSLQVHAETQVLASYALAMARSDGSIGPQLHRAAVDCTRAEEHWVGLPVAPRPIAGGANAPCAYLGPARLAVSPDGGRMAFRGVTMEAFARFLATAVRRGVRDRTELTGYFDGEFDSTTELAPPPPPPGVPDRFERDSLPSIFSVLPEQLGLRLESQRGPVEVLVIDGVEHPMPD